MSRNHDPEPQSDNGRSRHDFEQGLPDHHDPLAGIGGSPPALSALTLRAVLALLGLVLFVLVAVFSFRTGRPLLGAVCLVLALVGVVDLGVIIARKRRGEPG